MRKLVVNAGIWRGILSSEEEIALHKRIGWDGVFTDWSESFFQVAKKIKEENLFYHSVHAPYHGCRAIWEEGEQGERAVQELISCLRDCDKVGVRLVVSHAFIGFGYDTKPNQIGIERFGRVFQEAERLGITVALENTEGEDFLECLERVYKENKSVGFCIDTGHEFCYNGGQDLIGKYAEKLVSTHLNDNLGQTGEEITCLDDAHLLPFDGKVDWERVVRRLCKAGYQKELTFELKRLSKTGRNTHEQYERLSPAEFMKLAYKKAQTLREWMEEKTD